MKVQKQEKVTNDQGQVLFTNLPIGQYVIEVTGNEEFQSTTKVVNILNEEEKDTIQVFVGLRKRMDTDIEFLFQDDRQDVIDSKKVDAKAILIPE